MALRPKGRFGFRRTLEYLESGRVYLKDNVKTISVHYKTHGVGHRGLQRFWHEHIPQIQYKNPDVQIFSEKNIGELPIVRIYFGDGRKTKLDVEGKSSDTILEDLKAIAAQTGSNAGKEAKPHPADFGQIGRKCICEIPGQVPCPAKVPLQNVSHSWHNKGSSS
ncbi:small ribosomal subunit protein mS25-like [Corticium candelabrum]|uniref:small ribosomal subunit protein mS25-like n=1 Tax=Corticium candelabrum TaxID=121492 RepID=UPI002E26FBC9|nr:small ribosomal subunit protein mS25-like [Corticium candelabrum]